MTTTATATVTVVAVQDLGALDGSCRHCGTGIRYAVTVQLPDGSRQVWGRVCAGVTPRDFDARLLGQQRAALAALAAEQLADDEQLAEAVAAVDAAVARYDAAVATLTEQVGAEAARDLACLMFPSWEARRTAEELRREPLDETSDSYEYDRVAALEAMRSVYDLHTEPLPVPQHVGTVGARETHTVTIVVKRWMEAFCYGARQSCLVKAVTEDGDTLVTFSSGSWVDGATVGATMTLTGTITEHGEYGGLAETKWTRVAVAGVKRTRRPRAEASSASAAVVDDDTPEF